MTRAGHQHRRAGTVLGVVGSAECRNWYSVAPEDNSTADLAAVSYSIRQRLRSRRLMSSRVRSYSTSAWDKERARSGRGLRRTSIREMSAASQPCRCQYAAADLAASRETFHVDGARSPYWAAN